MASSQKPWGGGEEEEEEQEVGVGFLLEHADSGAA